MKDIHTTSVTPQPSIFPTTGLPESFLNAYVITNASEMVWTANLYKIQRVNQRSQTHDERGDIKQLMWQLRRKHKDRCQGYGYVVDVSPDQVAIPTTWQFPHQEEINSFRVTREKQITITPASPDPLIQKAAIGIIREGIKAHFKDNKYGSAFGELWQDGRSFCEMPHRLAGTEFGLYRRYFAGVKILSGNQVVMQCRVSTAMLDGRSLGDYFLRGEGDILARYISAKQAGKFNRQNQPFGVRVLHLTGTGGSAIVPMDLENPETFAEMASLPIEKQAELAKSTTFCRAFPRDPEPVPLAELFLVLDSQITQDEHSETILEPKERFSYTEKLRNFLDGAEIYGRRLSLAHLPVDATSLPVEVIPPPAILVRGANGRPEIIPAPRSLSVAVLKERVKMRAKRIRENGYLEERPIRPLLAYPRHMTEAGGKRMEEQLNKLLDAQGIEYRFAHCLFNNVEEIRKEIEKGNHDALLVVLPDKFADGKKIDFYEQVKKTIEVPSQCILARNTLPRRLVSLSPEELWQQEKNLVRRLKQRYELCVLNLLIKHHWIPFVPAEGFNYNVQLGIDVGGAHNTHAVSCFGYGFSQPQQTLIFRPDEIPIGKSKAEPIPKDSLYEGLLNQFGVMRTELLEAGVTPDFETALFIRDGQLLGDEDRWNEKDDLDVLHAENLKRKWVSEKSVWTAVEVMKFADGWRLFDNIHGVENPLAGTCIRLFNDDSTFLVFTTGRQYLTQGTACPLLFLFCHVL
ncbi:MAG: hypothetical protein QOH25_468 [Acidobacteriota bacterium]|nr:hypothetical protein [Acidobacteriota bacterium]